MPLLTYDYGFITEWTKNGKPIEPVLVGPDDNGVFYRYKPRITEGNKTIHFGVSKVSKTSTDHEMTFAGRVTRFIE